ncbi:hypothetical protein, partial [Arthrobacter sp. DR-2P]
AGRRDEPHGGLVSFIPDWTGRCLFAQGGAGRCRDIHI